MTGNLLSESLASLDALSATEFVQPSAPVAHGGVGKAERFQDVRGALAVDYGAYTNVVKGCMFGWKDRRGVTELLQSAQVWRHLMGHFHRSRDTCSRALALRTGLRGNGSEGWRHLCASASIVEDARVQERHYFREPHRTSPRHR